MSNVKITEKTAKEAEPKVGDTRSVKWLEENRQSIIVQKEEDES